MDLEMLREFQQRGRFFYEMFPGAKASEEWQRHRDQTRAPACTPLAFVAGCHE